MISLLSLLTLCIALVRAGKILDFSYTGEVSVGEWASFSCTIKAGKGSIKWRIGEATEEDGITGAKLNNLIGVVARRVNHKVKNHKKFEDIEILATEDLNGIPVQCLVVDSNDHSKIDYSKFAILRLSDSVLTGSYNNSQIFNNAEENVPRNKRSIDQMSGATSLHHSITIALLLSAIATLYLHIN